MNEVRRSLVAGWRATKVKGGRITIMLALLLLSWLVVGWLVGRLAVGPQ
jgi:hypothetical protein